jgi:glycosyltransferase involved in cell wall biosynthesis
VIVPNYNHGRYLQRRLDSIFNQTFRDVEVIVLDDASSDDSLQVIEPYRDRADVRVVANEKNSGSTFAQWLKGIDAARADVIWIAESDDGCEPDFIETLLPALRDPLVKLAYANSNVWNEQSVVVGDYTGNPYLTSLSATKWSHAYRVSAEQEMNDGLGVKNTILSASAVMFRKFDLSAEARHQLETMQIAGDWYFFAHALAGGEIWYTPAKLNYHRRHDESVVGKLLKQNRAEQFFREFSAVQGWIAGQYRLGDGFETAWERYLRDQWAAFFPERPFEDLRQYYPLDQLRGQIAASRSRPTAASR